MKLTNEHYNRMIPDRYSADPSIDDWQLAIDIGLTIIAKKDVPTSALLWICALCNVWRDIMPRIQNIRIRKIHEVGSENLRDPHHLNRRRGNSESHEDPASYLSRGQFGDIVDRAVAAKKYSDSVDRLFRSANLLFDACLSGSQGLAYKRIQEYRDTPANKRLSGDNSRIAFLINWTTKGKFQTELADDALHGWRESKGLAAIRFSSWLNRRVKQLRGKLRQKGEESPSWKLNCDDWRKFRSQDNPIDRAKLSRHDRDAIGIRYCHHLGIYGGQCTSRDTSGSPGLDYAVYRMIGIKQNTIARWVRSKGVDWARIYPSVTAIGQPETIDRDGFIYYALPCSWDRRDNAIAYAEMTDPEMPRSWIVWRDGMNTVYHVSTAPNAIDSVHQSIQAIQERINRSRYEAEQERLSRLSDRQKLAALVRRCRRIPELSREHSYRVGNCHPGTASFIARLGLDNRETVDGMTIARLWRSQAYCERSYFGRVIQSIPDSVLRIAHVETE